jgi:hypothetical protein
MEAIINLNDIIVTAENTTDHHHYSLFPQNIADFIFETIKDKRMFQDTHEEEIKHLCNIHAYRVYDALEEKIEDIQRIYMEEVQEIDAGVVTEYSINPKIIYRMKTAFLKDQSIILKHTILNQIQQSQTTSSSSS